MEEYEMNRRTWLWVALLGLPVAVGGGLAYANHSQARTFTCPLTGEELPCSKCCPLNGEKAEAKVEAKTDTKKEDQTFISPVTGEELACPKCCPLNKAKTK